MTMNPSLRCAVLAVAGLVLAGCGGARQGPTLTSQFTQVTATEAFASLPPGAPETVAVIQKNFRNARSQDIILSTVSRTPGQNRLTVSMFGPMPDNTGSDNVLPNPIDTIPELGVEVRKEFQTVPMQISTYFVQNKYGPFGYAMGRPAPGELCMYAWQRITQTSGPNVNLFFTTRGAIVVRMRICETGATESSLIALMYGYVINATFTEGNWNPYGTPVQIDHDLGKAGGDPVTPIGLLGDATVLEGVVGPAPETVVTRRSSGAIYKDAELRQPNERNSWRPGAASAPQEPERDYSGYASVPPPPGGN
ncbi:cellulose biosynthesis protein BcsN [Terrihabitans rhizophilus]|uniref:Cellulose biosynthesis protein BcsN n=1 Tax=Terrihabitans rhizophilus TaxID=3092662 RepID=A0ABU4RQT0_9HYPH|nr:cellulose biosynthesis protein BcsN [Terrihabitans sp. PJ23]MDX6806469.1 cellulose biosynthesis protein BcsN [Terrihabitans sp. PJ23]